MKVIDLIEILKTKDPYMEVLTEGLYDDYYPIEVINFKKTKILKTQNSRGFYYTVPFGVASPGEEIIDALVL